MVQALACPRRRKSRCRSAGTIADWCDRFSPFVAADAPDGLAARHHRRQPICWRQSFLCCKLVQRNRRPRLCRHPPPLPVPPWRRALWPALPTAISPRPGLKCKSLALRWRRWAATTKFAEALRTRRSQDHRPRCGCANAANWRRGSAKSLSPTSKSCWAGGRPIDPRRPLPDLSAEQRFADPIVTADAIAHSLAGLTQSLCEHVEQRGLGLRTLEAAFFRATAPRGIALRLGTPLRDAGILLQAAG